MEAFQQYLTGHGKPYCSTIELGMEASKQYSSKLGMGSPLTVLINYWDVLSGLSSDRHVHHLRHVRSACLSAAAPSCALATSSGYCSKHLAAACSNVHFGGSIAGGNFYRERALACFFRLPARGHFVIDLILL